MFEIRRARMCDLSCIKELAAPTVPQAYEGLLTTEQIDYLEDLSYSQNSMAASLDSGTVYFIAAENGEDCGFASVCQEGPDLFHMPKIYVLKAHQRHGIGTALVSEIEKHIKQVHPEPCTLEIYVNSRNAAADFYHQRGFAKVRERNIAFDNGFVLIQEVLQKNL